MYDVHKINTFNTSEPHYGAHNNITFNPVTLALGPDSHNSKIFRA